MFSSRNIAHSATKPRKISLGNVRVILQEFGRTSSKLPTNPRTILYIPRGISEFALCIAVHAHFGLQRYKQTALELFTNKPRCCLKIQLKINGASILLGPFKQLWPILSRLVEKNSRVFLVGVYCGAFEPHDVYIFLIH